LQLLNKKQERRDKIDTLCGHQVLLCFAGKDGEEIEDVEKKILICMWHRMNEFLVRGDDHVLIIWRFRYRILSAARQKKVTGSKMRTYRVSELPLASWHKIVIG
jgi:hypothetical protein